MSEPVKHTVVIEGVETEVVVATDFNSLNDRFTTTQGELTQWQQGIKKPDVIADPPAPKPDPTAPKPNPLALEGKPPASTAFDLAAYEELFVTNGTLSDVEKAAVKAAGYDVDVVTYNFQSKQQRATDDLKRIYDSVGGEESLNAVRTWADANLDAGQKVAYDAILSTGNVEAIMSHLSSLKLAMGAAEGTPPASTLQGGAAPAAGALTGYATQNEFADARRDARYKTDPDYRKNVDHRAFLTEPSVLGWRQG